MLTLSYSACYDPYNTIFRMVTILNRASELKMGVETLKIADFFLCFPKRLEEVKPPNSVKGMRGRCNSVLRGLKADNFEILPSSTVLFSRMNIIQEASMSAMAAKGIIRVSGEDEVRQVKLNQFKMDNDFDEMVSDFISKNIGLVNLLARDFPEIQIKGSNGLKARTGLGTYAYDTV